MATSIISPKHPTESQEQQDLIAWAKWQKCPQGIVGDYLFSIPNGAATTAHYSKGGRRVSISAFKLVAEGLKRGVPDLMLAIPSNGCHGLFIEMKRAKKSLSKVSAEQKVWIERLNAQGYRAVICCGFEAAKREIQNYLQLPEN